MNIDQGQEKSETKSQNHRGLITSESSSTDLSDEKAAYGKLCENFWPVFGDMPEIVITKESFQIIDSIYSQMVAEIIVIIFYYFTFKDVLKCF